MANKDNNYDRFAHENKETYNEEVENNELMFSLD